MTKSNKQNEIVAIVDEKSWIWPFIKRTLSRQGSNFVRLPTDVPVRPSWKRFKNSQRLIIHWEGKERSGGAIIEAILDVDPHYDVADRVIILTTNPTHEDVVYYSELGVKRVIHLRNTESHLLKSFSTLLKHLTEPPDKNANNRGWRKLLKSIDTLPKKPSLAMLNRIKDHAIQLARKTNEGKSARLLDAMGSLALYKDQIEQARLLWYEALSKNPNYYRAYNHLIKLARKTDKKEEALALMRKMYEINKANIARIVSLGEIYVEMNNDERAQHFFNNALKRDKFSAGALNGLAEIKFRQGDLDASRKLLYKSQQADRIASKLNKMGIEMVKAQKYSEALEHYTRAQYVLPQQEKGPMLFYNIGLCYYKWGKHDISIEFLKLALIKDPSYSKAFKLLTAIQKLHSAA